MHRFASALVAAVAIVLNAAPAAFAAGTSPVELVPAPWTHADTGAPPLPVDTPQYAIQIRVSPNCQSVSPCPGFTGYETTITLDSGATVFDQTIGGFRFRGRVVSSIAANVWALGIRNLRLTLPAMPEIGGTLSTGDVTMYFAQVTTFSFAGFTVPFDGKNAMTTIVTKESGNPVSTEIWSGRLQSRGDAGPGDALTSNLLAGDEITVYEARVMGPYWFSANVSTEPVPGSPGTYRVTSKTESRNACISGPEPAEGYDCTSTLEIFTPRVIPSTLATTCASDLTGDGVVNFADLAKMKSVFFKTCTP